MNNRVLGRGLSSLLKEEVLPVDTGTTQNNLLNIEQIEVGKYQPRKNFNEEKLRELANSIISNGLVQPIIVGPTVNGKYQIIAGERRYRACKMAGLAEIPVIIKNLSEDSFREIILAQTIVNLFTQYKTEVYFQHDYLIYEIFKSFESNWDKIEIISKKHFEFILELFIKLGAFHIKTLDLKDLKIEENIFQVYDLLVNLILNNLQLIRFKELSEIIIILDSLHYKSDKLNKEFLNFVILELKSKNYKNMSEYIFIIFKNNSLLKNPNESNEIITELVNLYYNRIIKNDIEMNFYYFTQNIKLMTQIHCVLIELNNNNQELNIRINYLFITYINLFYLNFKNYDKKYIISHSLYYLKSISNKINDNNFTYQLDCLLFELSKKFNNSPGQNFEIMSNFHKEVLKYLILLKISYKIEDKNDYISKDIAIFKKGKKISIEVDGPKHFYRDKDIKFPSTFKKNILKNFGWNTQNISFFEWIILDDKQKLEYIKNKIKEVL